MASNLDPRTDCRYGNSCKAWQRLLKFEHRKDDQSHAAVYHHPVRGRAFNTDFPAQPGPEDHSETNLNKFRAFFYWTDIDDFNCSMGTDQILTIIKTTQQIPWNTCVLNYCKMNKRSCN